MATDNDAYLASAFLDIDLELREVWDQVRADTEECGDAAWRGERLWGAVEEKGLEDQLGALMRWCFAIGYFARRREEKERTSPRFGS